MATVRETERTLAVVTSWGLFGSFGLGFILSGVASEQITIGLLGFATLVIGFIAHVIINRFFGTGFRNGEVVVGFLVFGVSLLGFMGGWIFDPNFDNASTVIGLAGFGAIIACFVVYLVAKFGLKGSFSMFHRMRSR